MACNDCGKTEEGCGCQQEALSISQVCNPVVCAVEECSETFNAGCILYADEDIICNDVVLVTTGDTMAQALANVSAYFCSTESVGAEILCGVDVVVPANTSLEDSLPLIVTYFCDVIANLPIDEPQATFNSANVSFVDTVEDPSGCVTRTYTITYYKGIDPGPYIPVDTVVFSTPPICPGGGGAVLNQFVFEESFLPSSGNFTVPAGVTQLTVEVWGGASGGSMYEYPGVEVIIAAGGGGGYAKKFLTVTPGDIIPWTLGAGGGVVTVSAEVKQGDDGQDSNFGSVIALGSTASVMVAGTPNVLTSAIGGNASGGDFSQQGSNGERLALAYLGPLAIDFEVGNVSGGCTAGSNIGRGVAFFGSGSATTSFAGSAPQANGTGGYVNYSFTSPTQAAKNVQGGAQGRILVTYFA